MLTNMIVITIVVLIVVRLIFQDRAITKLKERIEELESKTHE